MEHKLEMLIALVSAIVCVSSNAIPVIPHFTHDCKGSDEPNCSSGARAMHDAMMRVLAANHEYGRGIHSLHKLYNQLSHDFTFLKNQLNSLEKKFVQDKLQQINERHTNFKPQVLLKPSPDIQIHGHPDHTSTQTLEDLLAASHMWSLDEFNSFQTLLINITTSLRTQGLKTSKLFKRVNSFRKDVKKCTHLVRQIDKKQVNFVDKLEFEENWRKQRGINGQLESRLSQVENLLNSPHTVLQNDGYPREVKTTQGE